MSNFLYNGVELPGLPETWNEAAHPYLFIRVVSLDGSAENAVYSLFAASAAAVSYDDNGILFPSSAVGEKYAVSDGAWAESSESLSDAFYIKRNDGFLYTLWANFDILNSDGSVYIAASEPVPVVEKFPIREWIGWLLAGLCSRPLPMGAREPVAYLYNGVRLPGLPEEHTYYYKHRYITKSYFGEYILHTSTFVPYLSEGDNGMKKYVGSGLYSNFVLGNKGWEFLETHTADNESFITAFPIWTDIDLSNEDGEVILSASEPIPVYE